MSEVLGSLLKLPRRMRSDFRLLGMDSLAYQRNWCCDKLDKLADDCRAHCLMGKGVLVVATLEIASRLIITHTSAKIDVRREEMQAKDDNIQADLWPHSRHM